MSPVATYQGDQKHVSALKIAKQSWATAHLHCYTHKYILNAETSSLYEAVDNLWKMQLSIASWNARSQAISAGLFKLRPIPLAAYHNNIHDYTKSTGTILASQFWHKYLSKFDYQWEVFCLCSVDFLTTFNRTVERKTYAWLTVKRLTICMT